MELFKTTCVTCRARLSVRDAALIGQIVACPRCGSMVQVEAPPEGIPKLGGAAAALASLAAAPREPLAPPAPQPLPAAGPPAETANPTPAVQSPDISAFEDAADALTDFPPTDEPAPTAPAAEESLASAATGPGWSALRLATVILGGVSAGSLLVAASIYLLGSDDQPATRIAADPPVTPQAVSATTSTTESEQPTPLSSDPTPPPDAPAETTAAADEAPPAPGPATTELSAAQGSAVSSPPEATAPTPPSVVGANEVPPEAAPQQPANPSVAEAPRLRIDPLDVDPEGLSLATLYHAPARDPLAGSQAQDEVNPATSVPVNPASEPDAALMPPAAAEPLVRRDASAGLGVPQDAAAILARIHPAMEVEKMPLCRLLDQAVQLTGLPVSVAPRELQMARVWGGSPASAAVTNATIVEFLTKALAPLRLAPIVEQGQIRLAYVGQNRRRSISYAIDDLAGTPAERQQLADRIKRLIAPESWQAAESLGAIVVDGPTLRIEQDEPTQYEIVILLERYRLARGLPPRSKYPASLLDADSSYTTLLNRLAAPATFTFSSYTELREIFRYWQEELDVVVLVDWPALADERLWPQARIACSAAGKPWTEALDSVLSPLGLGWRAIDRRTIEITSLTKVREEPQLEIYRLATPSTGAGSSAGQSILEVAKAASEAAAAVEHDAVGGVLLVRQSAAGHRSLASELARMPADN